MKEPGYDFDIPELTDAQIENWRELLVTLPLPPFNHPIGSYSYIMPRHDIEILVGRMQSFIDEQSEETQKIIDEETKILLNEQAENVKEKFGIPSITTEPSNLIRTRPRDPNKPTRG